MIAFALYTPRLATADLSGPGVYLSGLMANTHHLTGPRPITYGNGRARLTFFLFLVLSFLRPFSVSLFLLLSLLLVVV